METLRMALGDIAEVTKLAGFEFTKHIEYLPEGEIIAIRGLNVKKGILDLTDIKRISIKASDLLPRSKLFKNDLVLTYTGTIGEVALITEDDRFHLAPNVAVVRPSGVNPYYLYCYMRSRVFKRDFETFSVGSTQKTVPMKNIRQVEIPLLPEKTQIEIGRIISLFDDKIELNQKMNQTLEEIAKSIFKSWFVDFDPVRTKAEGLPTSLPPEISDLFPDELVDSEIGEIPRGWEVLPLSECAIEIESGRRPKGGIDKSLNHGIPSVGAESIAPAGEFDFSKVKYVTTEFAETMKKGKVKNFDVALYKDGGKPGQFIPRVGIYGNSFPFENFFVNEHVFLLRSGQLGQPFLYRLVASDAFLAQLIAKGSAKAAQPGLNQTEVIESTFVCPSKSVTNLFNKKIQPLLERQFLLGRENEVLSELRDTLLTKLISGEIRIPDAEKFLEEAGI